MVLCPNLYFPPVYFFSIWKKNPPLVIEQWETYQKRSLRNKCIVAGTNGPQILTVPLLKGKHQAQQIKEVKISYAEDWPRLHLRTIRSCYGKSPFFDYYYPSIDEILRQKYTFLFDLNLHTLDWLRKVLHLDTSDICHYEFSHDYLPKSNLDSGDWRNAFGSKSFQDSLIPKSTPYNQVFEEKTGFIPNLSSLDLLFCTGPEACSYL